MPPPAIMYKYKRIRIGKKTRDEYRLIMETHLGETMKTKVNVIFVGSESTEPEVGKYYEFNGEMYQVTDRVVNGLTDNTESLYLCKVNRICPIIPCQFSQTT